MKIHMAHVDRANESDNSDYWSDTYCGKEIEENYLTDQPKEVTCKICLKLLTPSTHV